MSEYAESVPISSASCYLDELRDHVSRSALDKQDLLLRLEALQQLLRDDAQFAANCRNRTQAESTKRKAESRKSINYSLPSRDLYTATESFDKADGRSQELFHSDDCSDDGSDDADTSFARLSYLLERSIYEGRDALDAVVSPFVNDSALDYQLAAPIATAQHTSGEIYGNAKCEGPTSLINRNDPVSSPVKLSAATMSREEIDSHCATNTVTTASPPSYNEHSLSSSRLARLVSESVVDDGVAALETLIDQIALNVQHHSVAGLTSTNFVIITSFLVFIVAYLASSEFRQVGINCHCICPVEVN